MDFHKAIFAFVNVRVLNSYEDGTNMLKRFYPDEYVASAYEIDFKKLYDNGCRGIIFDIDNTLVPHGAPADEKSKEFIAHLKEIGYRVMLLSNNKEPRVKSFNDVVGAEYIYKAGKPSVGNYRKAMERMNTKKENTLFVGDQIFTDIWGANRVGLRTYLVKPIHPKEEIQIILKRYLEKVILFFYSRYGK